MQNECFQAMKNIGITLLAEKWMEPEIIMWSEISQAQKGKHCIFHSYVESRPKILLTITGPEYKGRLGRVSAEGVRGERKG
jgi:hypothetical protein